MSSSVAAHVEKAYQRIKDNIRKTPLEYSAWLSECSNCNVYIKLGKFSHVSFMYNGTF